MFPNFRRKIISISSNKEIWIEHPCCATHCARYCEEYKDDSCNILAFNALNVLVGRQDMCENKCSIMQKMHSIKGYQEVISKRRKSYFWLD